MYAIVVHGGAGTWAREVQTLLGEGVLRSAETGVEVLARSGPAVDAVVAAVRVLEDNPIFNAGTGSALTIEGEVEMDAGLMVGAELRTGAVACLRRVRNPIMIARKVMEETDHVILAGAGALRFARALGFPDYDPVTSARRSAWLEGREKLLRGEETILPAQYRLLSQHPELGSGTVGAVALDCEGVLAAATSTGGISLKLSGRVGDTAVPGAGNYADTGAAVSATGRGELMMRFLTAKTVCDRIGAGSPPQGAVQQVLSEMAARVGAEAGIIAVDAKGRVGVGHRTEAMPYAYATETQPTVAVRMRAQS